MKRKDYLFGKCHGSGEEGEKNSNCGLGLEGCVEAGGGGGQERKGAEREGSELGR